MFNDESWENDNSESIEELLQEYENIKNGRRARFLDEDDFEYLIDYFHNNNNETEALTACDTALAYYPYSAAILLFKAEILFQSQKYGQALNTLDTLDSIDRSSLEAVLLRSDIYLAQFKYDQAVSFLEDKLEDFEGKEKTELMLELSDVYDECEDYEAVFETLKRILEVDYRNEEALHKVSFWADFSGKQEESIVMHQRIIDLDPYNALAWFNLGAAYQGLKQHENALDAYEFCVAIDEKFEFAYRNMADAYIRLHWYEKAIESLEKNLELGKPEDVIFEAMGHCFEKQKNFDKARYYYRQAIQLNPADDSIFFRIGETYSREKQWEKAIKAYTTALSLNEDNAAYCLAIGNCLMQLDAFHEALICFANAVRLKPNNKSSWLALIKGLYKSGDFAEALSQIQLAKETLGDKPDFDYYYAGVLFALGRSKEALIHLEQAMDQAPTKLKLLTEINPDILQRKAVAELWARKKRKK